MITMQSFLLLAVYLAVLLALAWPMGIYFARVGGGTAIRGLGWLRRIEDFLYRIAGTSASAPMRSMQTSALVTVSHPSPPSPSSAFDSTFLTPFAASS